MAASPRNHYSPSQLQRHQQPRGGGSSLLRRLLKYLAAGLGVYALGYWHGAGQTPTVPAAAAADARGAFVRCVM